MIKGVFVILLYMDTAMPILGREYGTYSFRCRQNIFVIFFVTGVVVNNNHNTPQEKIKILGNSRSTRLEPRLNQIFKKLVNEEVKPTMVDFNNKVLID